MISYPYKNQNEQKEKLKTGDWILFQETKNTNALWSGEIVSIDKDMDTVVVCTDIDNNTQDDFTISEIVVHIEAEWEGFAELADKSISSKY